MNLVESILVDIRMQLDKHTKKNKTPKYKV
jgi:hypothetical protein